MLKQALQRLLPAGASRALAEFKAMLFDDYARVSYAQEGEDLILAELLRGVDRGFYVDIGAHHPRRFSNTYYFYRRGWRGVNVDARPGGMAAFRRWRPRDINVEAAVGRGRSAAVYHQFRDAALNTLDPDLARWQAGKRGEPFRTVAVTTQPLADVLRAHLPPAQGIDFLSVDVEGLELEVLESNDWSRFRPGVIVTESLHAHVADRSPEPVRRLLAGQGYRPVAGTLRAVFYRLG
ncbi:MAG: FkbM family methyltransferase [Kiritimatiellae bacterium]|nr:FkbM family methyltransferase [Kiritimatiellia bacterium]